MRKQLLTLLCFFLVQTGINAQTFTDNFDNYTAGNWLCTSNSAWKTWGNTPGGADDVKISSTKAYNGTNSIYFGSVSGGPSDIVLPFGGQFNTGNFDLSFYLFVETGKKAYINLQEQTEVGKAWTLDLNFDSVGNFSLVNTQSGSLLNGAYPVNQWIKISIAVNLNTNSWNFLINDVSAGTFQNSYRQVASLNFYPTANNGFFIDNVSYTYTPFTLPSLNAAVTLIDKVNGKLAGQKTAPSIEIRNLGTTAITQAEVEVAYNGNQSIKTAISNINVANLAYVSIPMNAALSLVAGKKDVVARLTQINGAADPVTADNSKTININPVVPAKDKMVVVEEATGTWSSWSPRGAVWMHNMEERYNGYFLGVAVHNNDPMENANYDAGIGTRISVYPSAIVDRGIDIDPSAMEGDFLTRIVIEPKGVIKNGAIYNSSSKELKVSLVTKFNAAVTGNWKLAFVLIEDSVTGTGAGWSQANSYAGGSRGPMGGYENLPNPVPAAQMVYDHVGRIIYPNFNGLSNAYKSSINANDTFVHNFAVTLENTWDLGQLKIAGILIDPTGKIDNGSLSAIEVAIANGYVNGTLVASLNEKDLSKDRGLLYPNPSKDLVNIVLAEPSRVEVMSLDGKIVFEQLAEGTLSIATDNWTKGMYLVKVQSKHGEQILKLLTQ